MDEPFPKVTYGPDYGPRVEWENFVLVQALQSAQGAIGPSVRGLAVEAGPRKVVLHACLSHRDDADMEELRDLTSDLLYSLEYLCDPVPEVALDLYFGETDESWPGYRRVRLYLISERARAVSNLPTPQSG